ncbi:MAG TPA: hypothetical protein VKA38_01140 [Draconibacterium sp.]|nr:hypothetical protein [Draconibacterium sp.]
MKKSTILHINRVILTMVLCLAFSFLFAQEHNLKTELLVYIMPDSLELPAYEKGKVTLQNATINSPLPHDCIVWYNLNQYFS